jgi:hypothetical protein
MHMECCENEDGWGERERERESLSENKNEEMVMEGNGVHHGGTCIELTLHFLTFVRDLSRKALFIQ